MIWLTFLLNCYINIIVICLLFALTARDWRALVSWAIWAFLQLPLIISSYIAVPIMLLCGWEGYSTWYGNVLYGKYGNGKFFGHSFWRDNAFWFLVVRNPVSNFGKFVLGVAPEDTWAWLVDSRFLKYGWGETVDERTGTRKFYFRPKLGALRK